MMDIEVGSFRRSSYCADGGCVEIADTSGYVCVRDAKIDGSPMLKFDLQAWKAFVATVRSGALD